MLERLEGWFEDEWINEPKLISTSNVWHNEYNTLTCIVSFTTFLSFICGILHLETCFTSRCWSWEGNRRWSGKRSSQGIVKHYEGTRRESGEVCQQESISSLFVIQSQLWPLHWFLIIYKEPTTFSKNSDCVLFTTIYTN